MRFSYVPLFVLAIVFSNACVATRMQSPKQHRHLESSGGVSYDFAGDFIYPRVSGQMMLGLFDVMDVSGHVGSTGLSDFAGAGMRFYPTSWITLGGQFEYRVGNYAGPVFDDNPESEYTPEADTYRGVFRASLVHYGKYGGLYVGPQTIIHNVLFRKVEKGLILATLGAFMGAEYKFGGFAAIQAELSLSPILLYDNALPGDKAQSLSFDEQYFKAHTAQFSFGFTIYYQDFIDSMKSL